MQPQRVIGAPWSFSPEPWWRRKAQTKAPSSQWLFRCPLGAGHCTDSLLAMQGVRSALPAGLFLQVCSGAVGLRGKQGSFCWPQKGVGTKVRTNSFSLHCWPAAQPACLYPTKESQRCNLAAAHLVTAIDSLEQRETPTEEMFSSESPSLHPMAPPLAIGR